MKISSTITYLRGKYNSIGCLKNLELLVYYDIILDISLKNRT